MLNSAWRKVSIKVILELFCIQNFKWQVILISWIKRKLSSCVVNTSSVFIFILIFSMIGDIFRAYRPWSLALISKLRYAVLLVKYELIIHLDYAVTGFPSSPAIIYNSTTPVNCTLVLHRPKIWNIQVLVAISLSKRTSLKSQSLNLFCAIKS